MFKEGDKVKWLKAGVYGTDEDLTRGKVYEVFMCGETLAFLDDREEVRFIENHVLQLVSSNGMPELEAGMVIEYHHGDMGRTYTALYVNDGLAIGKSHHTTSVLGENSTVVITKVYKCAFGNFDHQFRRLKSRLIWKRKDNSETLDKIAELEKSAQKINEQIAGLKEMQND